MTHAPSHRHNPGGGVTGSGGIDRPLIGHGHHQVGLVVTWVPALDAPPRGPGPQRRPLTAVAVLVAVGVATITILEVQLPAVLVGELDINAIRSTGNVRGKGNVERGDGIAAQARAPRVKLFQVHYRPRE